MADNTPITAGSGTTIGTDDVSGVHFQKIKIADGTADSSAMIGGDATNGLDVDVTRVQGNVAVTLAAGAAAIAKAEDVASADADVGVPALAVRKATPANTSGTDGDYEFLQISTGRLWVSATVDAALPAGANAIGKLAANSGVDIGDIDVTSIIPGTGATNLGKAEDAAHASGDTGVMDLAVRRSDANSLTCLAGADDDYTPLTADTRGVLQVIARPNSVRSRVASGGLTTASTAYSIGDQAGTIFTFAGAAKVTGGTGTVRQITVLDKADIMVDMRIHFFRSSVTLASDNAAYAISDTDMQEYIGTVVMPSLIDGANNRYNSLTSVNLGYDCAATSLYAAIETRTANTFFGAATDINLTLHLDLD